MSTLTTPSQQLIVGRPLTSKHSTCPHATEMGALRELARNNIFKSKAFQSP